MTDYIKREDALDIVADNNVTGEITLNRYDKIIDGIYDIPSADVVQVVRCKDCRFCQMELYDGADEPWCDVHGKTVDTEDFCSWGKERQ